LPFAVLIHRRRKGGLASATASAASAADTTADFVILHSLAAGLFAVPLLWSCRPEAG
jgi:hypothetical protein